MTHQRHRACEFAVVHKAASSGMVG